MVNKYDIQYERKFYQEQMKFKNKILSLITESDYKKELTKKILKFVIDNLLSSDKISQEHKTRVLDMQTALTDYIEFCI